MINTMQFVMLFSLVILCNFSEYETTPDVNSDDLFNHAKVKFGKLLTSIANLNEQRLNALKLYTTLDKYNVASGILRQYEEKKGPIVAFILPNDNNPETSLTNEIYDNDHRAHNDVMAQNTVKFLKEHYNNDFKNSEEMNKSELHNYVEIIDENGIENSLYRTNNEPERDREENSDGEEIIRAKETRNKKESNDIKETNNRKESSDGKKTSEIEKLKLTAGTKIDKKDILRIWKSCSKKASRRCKKACKSAYKYVCRSYKCSKGMKKSFRRHCKSECKEKFIDDD